MKATALVSEQKFAIMLDSMADSARTPPELTRLTGCSNLESKRIIKQLRNLGYNISFNRITGYRLLERTRLPLPWEIQRRLNTKSLGRNVIIYRKRIRSTQDIALRLAETNEATHGLVVIAGTQTSGHGRRSRKWFSPPGGLWLSVLIKSNQLQPLQSTLLSLVGGLAARSAIAKCTGLQPTLKWPNDVFLNNKKVAGILGDSAMEEDQVKYVVIGVGINANLDKKQLEKIVRPGKIHTATSLSEHLNRPVDIICLAAELLNSLEFYYESLLRDGSRAVLEEWKKHASILNRNISILYEGKQRIIGKAVDVSEYGDLIIETARGSSLSISASSARVIQEKDHS